MFVSEKKNKKKTVNSFIKSAITLLFYLFEKYDTVALVFTGLVAKSSHIILFILCLLLLTVNLATTF